MSVWQPIETAPRDGTPVLLTGKCREWDDPDKIILKHPAVGRWINEEWLLYDGIRVDVIYPAPKFWASIPKTPKGCR